MPTGTMRKASKKARISAKASHGPQPDGMRRARAARGAAPGAAMESMLMRMLRSERDCQGECMQAPGAGPLRHLPRHLPGQAARLGRQLGRALVVGTRLVGPHLLQARQLLGHGHIAPALAEQLQKLLVLHIGRSEEHTSELQSPCNLVCRLLL